MSNFVWSSEVSDGEWERREQADLRDWKKEAEAEASDMRSSLKRPRDNGLFTAANDDARRWSREQDPKSELQRGGTHRGHTSDKRDKSTTNTQTHHKLLAASDFESVGSLQEALHRWIDHQIDEAIENGVTQTVTGDTLLRKTLLTFLPLISQRALFLQTMRGARELQRAIHVFGAPPYAFLRHGDADMLRAAGVSQGRANFAYGESSERFVIPNYSQFGEAQFVDEFDRHYTMQATIQTLQSQMQTPVAFFSFVSASQGGGASSNTAFVRIPKRSHQVRHELALTDAGRKSLTLPHPGETLRLRINAGLFSMLPGELLRELKGEHTIFTVRVANVRTPHRQSATAEVRLVSS